MQTGSRTPDLLINQILHLNQLDILQKIILNLDLKKLYFIHDKKN